MAQENLDDVIYVWIYIHSFSSTLPAGLGMGTGIDLLGETTRFISQETG